MEHPGRICCSRFRVIVRRCCTHVPLLLRVLSLSNVFVLDRLAHTHLVFIPVCVASTNFFFFYCYDYHRDLHSFPTRRSSDLIRKDRISSKSLMRLSICLWKPSIGD